MTLSTQTKPMWTSQTVWGAIAAIGAGLSTAVYAYQTGNFGEAMTSLVAAMGGVTALIGRINATSQIGRAVVTAVDLADTALENYANSKNNSTNVPTDSVPHN
jgi:hypothetical protein